MTRRLYYHDAYATAFEATAVERLRHDGQPALILDQTYFYPESGGQPSDRGRLNGKRVTGIFIREEDGAIVHVLDEQVESDTISGAIMWERRFDHMQQHTGQHILSQAFIQVAGAQTVGFHLSDNTVTIDLDRPELTGAQLKESESLANQIIWENRPVTVRMVTPAQARELPLRKIPPINDDKIRLIEIEHFDLTACGGTHVSGTGAVGLVKILKVERRGEQTRVEFCCGRRALADYDEKHQLVSRLATDFTTGYWNLEEVIATLRAEAGENRRLLQRQTAELLAYEARTLLAESHTAGSTRIVTATFSGRDMEQLRILANQLAAEPGVVALLALSGEKSRLLFARAGDAPGNMNQLLQQALILLGDGGGGGNEIFAQGGGPAATEAQVERALNHARDNLLAVL